MGTFNSLEPLDDVIQVIYHSLRRFVLISNATEFAWSIGLALKANPSSDLSGSYWWHARLSKKGVLQLAEKGSAKSDLGSVSLRILNCIKESNLAITGFDEEVAADTLKIMFDPDGIDPMTLDLKLLSSEQGLALAIDFAFSVGLQAKSGKQANFHLSTNPTSRPATCNQDYREALVPQKRQSEDLPTEGSHPTKGPILPMSTTGQRRTVPLSSDVQSSTSKPGLSKASAARIKRTTKKMQFESDDEN